MPEHHFNIKSEIWFWECYTYICLLPWQLITQLSLVLSGISLSHRQLRVRDGPSFSFRTVNNYHFPRGAFATLLDVVDDFTAFPTPIYIPRLVSNSCNTNIKDTHDIPTDLRRKLSVILFMITKPCRSTIPSRCAKAYPIAHSSEKILTTTGVLHQQLS
jgi:hypothetical protein